MCKFILKDGDYESIITIKNGKFVKIDETGKVIKLTPLERKTIKSYFFKDKVYFDSEDGYDIYFDKETKLIHYYKNDIEDLNKFAEKYEGETFMIDISCEEKVFRAKKGFRVWYRFILSSYILTSLYNEGLGMHFFKPADIEETRVLIDENGNLTDEDKAMLYNENLIEDIIPYYNESYSPYIFRKRLKDFKIKYFNSKDVEGTRYEDYLGWWDPDNNTINVNTDKDTNAIKGKEYINVLQMNTKYNYIKQASADLISSEYYNNEVVTHNEAVKNLKLLMETIGPEIIWKVNFQDDKELEQIIKSNLDSKSAKKLLYLLTKDPDSSLNIDKEIELLIELLYYNMYGLDARENELFNNILADNLYDRYYFNCDLKEKPSLSYYVREDLTPSIFLVYIAGEKMTYDEYLAYDNKDELILKSDGIILGDLIDYRGEAYTYQKAWENGLLDIIKPVFKNERYFDLLDDLENSDLENYCVVDELCYYAHGEYVPINSQKGTEYASDKENCKIKVYIATNKHFQKKYNKTKYGEYYN